MKFLKVGKSLARKSEKKFRHSALVLRGGNLISQGYNKDKRHAEIHALHSIWKDSSYYQGATLISIRIKKNGEYGHSRPCENCMGAIQNMKLDKVIYMDKMGQWVEEKV